MKAMMVERKANGLPKNCYRKIGHAGRSHYYFQSAGYRVRLPPPTAPDFDAAYLDAKRNMPPLDQRVRPEVIEAFGDDEKAMRRHYRIVESAAQQRAKVRGRAYTLPKHWLVNTLLKQSGKCALSGVGMKPSDGRFDPLSPSIDRIDPTGGYTPDNCHVVALGVNISKRDLRVEDFVALCRAVAAQDARTRREREKNTETRLKQKPSA